MHTLSQIANYWSQALKLNNLCELGQYAVNEKTIFIRKEDVFNGHLSGPVIEQLRKAVMVPILATNNTSIFVPFILEVAIDDEGYIQPAKHNTLPIVPRAVLEGASLNPIVLGNGVNFENYYSLYPPKWIQDDYQPTWQEQLEYALGFFAHTAPESWQEQLATAGYVIDENWSLIIPAPALEPEFAIENNLLSKLYAYEPGYEAEEPQLAAEIALIEAPRRAGKSIYIASLIKQDWMKSALSGNLPSSYVWLSEIETNLSRYANIFDCYSEQETWLTADIRKEIFEPQIFSDFSLTYCIQNFLSQVSHFLQKDMVHLEQAKQELLTYLQQEYLIYEESYALLKSWDDFKQVLIVKYEEHGTIHIRIRELKHKLGLIQQELRHFAVILAVWERLYTAANLWPTWFDSIRLLNYFKNHKLYRFYAQYFPDDKINMLSISAMNAKLFSRIQVLKDKEQLIYEAIHHASNELLQLDAMRLKCKRWFVDNYKNPINDYLEAQNYLKLVVLNNLNYLTLKYYETLVLDNFAWSRSNNSYAKYFIEHEVSDIDVLCVEHANYIPTIQALPMLTKARKALFFGNAQHLTTSLIPVSVDVELCKFAQLVTNDLDFEDLQFAGVLASSGTLWQFACKSLKVANKLSASYYVKPKILCIKTNQASQNYLGSKYNAKELELIKEQLIKMHAEKEQSINEVIIYTTFSGQRAQISNMLQDSIFAKVPVKLIQQPSVRRYKFAILSLVYDANEHPNLALEYLLANVADSLIVVANNFNLLAKHLPPEQVKSVVSA